MTGTHLEEVGDQCGKIFILLLSPISLFANTACFKKTDIIHLPRTYANRSMGLRIKKFSESCPIAIHEPSIIPDTLATRRYSTAVPGKVSSGINAIGRLGGSSIEEQVKPTTPPKPQQANAEPACSPGAAFARLPRPGAGPPPGACAPTHATAPVGARTWGGDRRPERTASSPRRGPHLFRASWRRTSRSSGASLLPSSSSSSSSVPARQGAFTTSPKNVAAMGPNTPAPPEAPQNGACVPAHTPLSVATRSSSHTPRPPQAPPLRTCREHRHAPTFVAPPGPQAPPRTLPGPLESRKAEAFSPAVGAPRPTER